MISQSTQETGAALTFQLPVVIMLNRRNVIPTTLENNWLASTLLAVAWYMYIHLFVIDLSWFQGLSGVRRELDTCTWL